MKKSKDNKFHFYVVKSFNKKNTCLSFENKKRKNSKDNKFYFNAAISSSGYIKLSKLFFLTILRFFYICYEETRTHRVKKAHVSKFNRNIVFFKYM